MEEKKPFIRENVNRKTSGRLSGVKRVLIVIGTAILFGVIACTAAVIFKPVAEKYLGHSSETETESQTLVIPRDDPNSSAIAEVAQIESEESTEETQPHTREEETGTQSEKSTETAEPVSSQEESTPETDETSLSESKAETEPETEAVGDIVDREIENYIFSSKQMDQMLKDAAAVCSKVDKSVVTVKAYTSGTDWFDNILEREGAFSGIVVAETVIQSIILTTDEAVKNADSLKIEWSNGFEQKAYIRAVSNVDGLAIISVNKSDMSEATRKLAVPVTLGNSFRTSRGELLYILGSPKGMTHSVVYTLPSYKAQKVSIPDGSTALVYADHAVNCTRGSWVINTAGELIGWSTTHYSAEEADQTDVIACISDYKSILERMINGNKYPYMGIVPVDVNDDMKNTGMPEGIYVREVIPDSPAYEAGIQPGDVISRMGEEMIEGVDGYRKVMETYSPGDTVPVVLNRDGRGEYKEIEYSVILGNR